MRVSVVARFVSHPSIEFGVRRTPGGRGARLGLPRSGTTFHARRRPAAATILLLRPSTSRFRFPSVGRLGLIARRPEPSRARRA
ncbi:MAG TPA: hypothetical protein VFM19_11270 [Candidatus Limnocylindria bacterium]|nr:hypothetical protein [Candidatus Limnocylindria bacterium]